MKKILLILVGGTICTAINEKGNLAVDEKAGALLKVNYENSDSPFAKETEITLSENLYILSENMTVEKWNRMLTTYRNEAKKDNYDGIIFAHGTDTLAYSSALFSMLLSDTKVPVFFVSANECLDSERTNGNVNFRAAVESICRGITPNVYVTYRNTSDGRMYLHLASHLRQCENYSEDFHSVDATDITEWTEQTNEEYLALLEQKYPAGKRKKFVDIFGDWQLRECVLMLEPYVGINYTAYDYSKFSAVLHGTFHSGTACAEKDERNANYGPNSILSMLDCCFNANPPVDAYLSPSVLTTGTYETVSIIGEHQVKGKSIQFLYGYTKEMAYAKLLLAYSLLETPEERSAFIQTEYNFERID